MRIVTAIMLLVPGLALALELSSPVDCTTGTDCFVLQFVDRDPSPGSQDFKCGPMSYDGHKGTDFALPSVEAMRRGVNVTAAADGRVTATRDGMPDRKYGDKDHADVAGRECGNGVVLAHSGSWTTQYCHILLGTVTVSVGDTVSAGDVLGRVGMSGKTEFPHLHFALRHGDAVFDPFDSLPMTSPCSAEQAVVSTPRSLLDVHAPPGGALSSGMLDHIPDHGDVWDNAPHLATMPSDTPAVVHWAHFYGLHKGDSIESDLRGPDGTVLAQQRHIMDRNRATEFRAIGRRRPASGWPPGVYTGKSRLIRAGEVIDASSASTIIKPAPD